MIEEIAHFVAIHPYIDAMIVMFILFIVWIIYEVVTAPNMPDDYEN